MFYNKCVVCRTTRWKSRLARLSDNEVARRRCYNKAKRDVEGQSQTTLESAAEAGKPNFHSYIFFSLLIWNLC